MNITKSDQQVDQTVTRVCLYSGKSEVQISDRSNRAQRCQRLAMTRKWATQTNHTLRRDTASVMEDLICMPRPQTRQR